jgi:hypothetical protein
MSQFFGIMLCISTFSLGVIMLKFKLDEREYRKKQISEDFLRKLES